jgi:hypothetical protein
MLRLSNFLSLLALAYATSAGAAEPLKRVSKVDIDGKTYRVRIAGDVAKASGAAIWTNPEDPTYFPRAKRAIEAASGCTVKDSYTTGNKLIATLDCGSGNLLKK